MDSLTDGEKHSFIYTVDEPRRGKAVIYYCWPLPNGRNPNERKFMKISLSMPAYSPGERPFWAKLMTLPMDLNRLVQLNSNNAYGNALFSRFNDQEIHNYYRLHPDTLILYLDREVVIEGVQPQFFGASIETRYKPDILIRRVQHRERIQQLSLGTSRNEINENSIEKRPISDREVRRPNLLILSPRETLEGIVGRSELIIKREPTAKGGLKITFTEYWAENAAYPRRLFRIRNSRLKRESKTLAIVTLEPWDYKRKVAWYIKIAPRRNRNGQYAVDIGHSQNVRVVLQTDRSLLSNTYEVPHLRFNFVRRQHGQINRPNEDMALRVGSWRQQVRQHGNRHIDLTPNNTEHFIIDLAIGYVPVLGDIIDIGEFIYSLVARRDRWGNNLDSWEILLMGLAAALPLMSSSGLRQVQRGIDDAGQATIRRTHAEIRRLVDNPRQFIEFSRPNALGDLGQAIRNRRGVYPAMEFDTDDSFFDFISEHVSMQGPRDESLSRLLNI